VQQLPHWEQVNFSPSAYHRASSEVSSRTGNFIVIPLYPAAPFAKPPIAAPRDSRAPTLLRPIAQAEMAAYVAPALQPVERRNRHADHFGMPCHQHRCCRRPNSTAAPDAAAYDYVLLSADNASAIDGITAILRDAGTAIEGHDLGLRLDCRGTNWQAALGHLSETLRGAARRGVRVALIPIAADARAFHTALLTSQPLGTFAQTRACTPAVATLTSTDSHFLSDVFKGESLE
jgi:hypothetical protein